VLSAIPVLVVRDDPSLFDRWYVNFQRPLSRVADGFDTLDHELDLWSRDGRTWHWKDEELLAERVAAGWFTDDEATAITANARCVHDGLRRHGPWWDPGWAAWAPPSGWSAPELPAGLESRMSPGGQA
jgi:hypothetical protein